MNADQNTPPSFLTCYCGKAFETATGYGVQTFCPQAATFIVCSHGCAKDLIAAANFIGELLHEQNFR